MRPSKKTSTSRVVSRWNDWKKSWIFPDLAQVTWNLLQNPIKAKVGKKWYQKLAQQDRSTDTFLKFRHPSETNKAIKFCSNKTRSATQDLPTFFPVTNSAMLSQRPSKKLNYQTSGIPVHNYCKLVTLSSKRRAWRHLLILSSWW